jgi:small subunit ribosomal protein S9
MTEESGKPAEADASESTEPTDAAAQQPDPKPEPEPKAKSEAAPKAKSAPKAKAAATPPTAPAASPTSAKAEKGKWWWGLGRRKTAVARVRICPGTGKFIINNRAFDKYLTEDRDQKDVMAVLGKTKTTGGVDVYVNVCGGGYTGQTGAIVLGLGRALLRYDASLEPALRESGFLSRDPRKVERKKYGQPGARARFQFSKR